MSNKNHAKSISITYTTNSPKSTVFRRIVYPPILCFTYLGRKEKHSDLNCEHYKLHVINNSKAVYTHTQGSKVRMSNAKVNVMYTLNLTHEIIKFPADSILLSSGYI